MRFSLVLCAAFVLALPACRGCGDGAAPVAPTAAERSAPDRDTLPDARVVCPVCGLEFNGKESVATRVHDDKTYYFLLEDHARAFATNPDAYLAPEKP